MARRVQDKKPKRSKATTAWIAARLREQDARHQAIAAEMDALEPTRRRWYQEFLQIIQTRGFNYDGENRRVIPPAEVPRKPRRKDRVVF